MAELVDAQDSKSYGSNIVSTFVDWHKKYIEYWKIKLNLSNYVILWIAFIKGLIIGLLVYHFIIN